MNAQRVSLYANGIKVREENISQGNKAGESGGANGNVPQQILMCTWQ